MYFDGGWTPPQEPPSGKPGFTKRQEQVFVGIIAVNAVFLLVAPIGGATVIHAILALLGYG